MASSPRFAAATYYDRLFERLTDQEMDERRQLRRGEYEDYRRCIIEAHRHQEEQLVLRSVESEAVLQRYHQVTSDQELRLRGSQKALAVQEKMHWLQQRGEKAARAQMLSTESQDRSDMAQREGQNLAANVVAELPHDERRWRYHILHTEEQEHRYMLGAIFAPVQIQFLTLRRGTHSEPNYRTMIQVQERRHRVALATRFVSLAVQWSEQWGRIKVRFCQRICHDHLLEIGHKVMRQEALEREEFRILYEPVADDIKEQLDSYAHASARRDRKMTVLKKMREVELQRMQDSEVDRADYVNFWKADELLKIQEAQEAIVRELAMSDAAQKNERRGRADGGWEEGEEEFHQGEPTWERLSRAFEQDLATLTAGANSIPASRAPSTYRHHHDDRPQQQQQSSIQPISFSEIVNYRKRLLQFDEFISAVEGAVSVTALDEQLDKLNSEATAEYEGYFSRLHPGGQDDEVERRALSAAYPAASSPGGIVRTPVLHEHSTATGRDLLDMLHKGYGWSELKEKKLKEKKTLSLQERGGGATPHEAGSPTVAVLMNQHVPMIARRKGGGGVPSTLTRPAPGEEGLLDATSPLPPPPPTSSSDIFNATTVTPAQLAALRRRNSSQPPQHQDQVDSRSTGGEVAGGGAAMQSGGGSATHHFDPNRWVQDTAQQELLQKQADGEARQRNLLLFNAEANAQSQNKVNNAIYEKELEKKMDSQLDQLHSWMNAHC